MMRRAARRPRSRSAGDAIAWRPAAMTSSASERTVASHSAGRGEGAGGEERAEGWPPVGGVGTVGIASYLVRIGVAGQVPGVVSRVARGRFVSKGHALRGGFLAPF